MQKRFAQFLTVCLLGVCTLYAQGVTKESVPGVTNFARLETTIACAGATKPEAVAALKQMGTPRSSTSVWRPRRAPMSTREAAAAKAAGITFIHLPFNAASPDPDLVKNFLNAVTDPKNQPAFVHCASGNRAAALWMIKRMAVDKWDAERAGVEAAALGLTSPTLKTFALDYVQAHKD